MARPKKCKIIDLCLEHNEFSPNITPRKTIYLFPEELQAIKLKDIDGLWVMQWAEKMWISKSTFANLYKKAHAKITQALIEWNKIQFKC